jgi:hypothetical protein
VLLWVLGVGYRWGIIDKPSDKPPDTKPPESGPKSGK